MTEKQIIEEYKAIQYWRKGLINALCKARLRKQGEHYRKTINEIEGKAWSIGSEVKDLYAEPIGRSVQARVEEGL